MCPFQPVTSRRLGHLAAYQLEKWASFLLPTSFVLFVFIYFAVYLSPDPEMHSKGYELVAVEQSSNYNVQLAKIFA
jgi:hypothetical protein